MNLTDHRDRFTVWIPRWYRVSLLGILFRVLQRMALIHFIIWCSHYELHTQTPPQSDLFRREIYLKLKWIHLSGESARCARWIGWELAKSFRQAFGKKLRFDNELEIVLTDKCATTKRENSNYPAVFACLLFGNLQNFWIFSNSNIHFQSASSILSIGVVPNLFQ